MQDPLDSGVLPSLAAQPRGRQGRGLSSVTAFSNVTVETQALGPSLSSPRLTAFSRSSLTRPDKMSSHLAKEETASDAKELPMEDRRGAQASLDARSAGSEGLGRREELAFPEGKNQAEIRP